MPPPLVSNPLRRMVGHRRGPLRGAFPGRGSVAVRASVGIGVEADRSSGAVVGCQLGCFGIGSGLADHYREAVVVEVEQRRSPVDAVSRPHAHFTIHGEMRRHVGAFCIIGSRVPNCRMGMTMLEGPDWERRAVQRTTQGIQLRSADRAQRVVAAVRALAMERGSTEFTMVEVAEASGVPLRTLYRQFPGRDELLLALLEEDARYGVEMLGAQLDDTAGPSARLQSFVLGLWDFMEKGSGYASVLVREHLRLAESHPDETKACLQPFVDLMIELMERAGFSFNRPTGVPSEEYADGFVMFSVLLAHMQAVLLFRPELDGRTAAQSVWQLFRSMSTDTVPGRQGRMRSEER
jgi:AcrR family transcriptional regulator